MTPTRTPPAPRTDNAAAKDALTAYKWEPQPEAEGLVRELFENFCRICPPARELAVRTYSEAGTRLIDLLDFLAMPDSRETRDRLSRAGFVEADVPAGIYRPYHHPGGIFTKILLSSGGVEAGIKVESVADFGAANGMNLDIEGSPLSSHRAAPLWHSDGQFLWAVERHGYNGFRFAEHTDVNPVGVLEHLEDFRMRPRNFGDEEETGFGDTGSIIDAAIDDLGRDYACDLFFAAEREYWMRRNRAAQFQYARQQRLGLGWANHDHHTYRSSRRHFARLVATWEKLGFVCRERFYAGAEAGWGAQVMEHPVTGIVTFNDVDLSPDELVADFAHEPLPERDRLGTVGLWCALHGESFLEAGMHHLECQFDFSALKQQLESQAGVKVMKPFTDFPYLRQAFTEGERWPVRPERIDRLLKDGLITAEQADKFRREGAIGSHLENLERNQGFKGFNQTGVSEIISATDPRKQ